MAHISLLITLLCFSLGTVGQDFDAKTQTCRRFSHQSALIGTRLFIDGGEVLVGSAGSSTGDHDATNTQLLFHDLSTLGPELMPELITNLSKPATVPSVSGGTLWPDQINGKLYLYGGEYTGGKPDDFAMWTYDAYENAWNKTLADSGISRAFRGASTTVQESGIGYYLGGWLGNNSVPQWNARDQALSGLLAYDFVNNHWYNTTGPVDGIPRVEGAMYYLPKGDSGLLVHFGGALVPNGDPTQLKPAPMEVIDVYDIAANTWYKQNATGDIPGDRRRFCGDIVAAPDSSSYNIYVYSGLGFNSSDESMGYGDLYILSLPSFTWVKLFEPGPDYIHVAHYDATCNIASNSQMIVVGQIAGKNQSTCDVESIAAIHSLDLGKQNSDKALWYHYRPNVTTNALPEELYQKIGGGPNGTATKTRPDAGYGDPNLKIILQRTVSATRAPTRTVPPEFGGPIPHSGMSAGTKAAIAVPTVVGGLAVILGALCLCRRRRRTQRAASSVPEDQKAPEMLYGGHAPPAYVPTAAEVPAEPYVPKRGHSRFIEAPGQIPAAEMSSHAEPVEMPARQSFEDSRYDNMI